MVEYLKYIFEIVSSVAPVIALAVFGVAASAAVFTAVQKSVSIFFRIPGLTGGPIPVAHKIAVIGLPGAGKTTLITGLFELIQRGADLNNVRLHGFQTIETVNRNIARLNSGMKIGPTRERDVFIFRFSYLKARRFITRLYDVEIADFPGEYSDRISKPSPKEITSRSSRRNKANDSEIQDETTTSSSTESSDDFSYALFHREFFSWIASAREYLFVVDLASVYSDEEPRKRIADIIARIRTSWQVIEDASTDRSIGVFNDREVHIIFTKMDTLISIYRSDRTISDMLNTAGSDSSSTSEMTDIESLRMELLEKRNSKELALVQKESNLLIRKICDDNSAVFTDLTVFFASRAKSVDVIYTSMTLSESDGSRLGVRKVLDAVLP